MLYKPQLAVVVAGAAALLVGCGTGPHGSSMGGSDPRGEDCPLSTVEVEGASGWKVSRSRPTGGYMGDVGGTALDVVWVGCRFEAVGGGRIQVGTLIGEGDRPDVRGYEALLKGAAEPSEAAAPAVGDDAFYDEDNSQLWVRTPTSTLTFMFFGSTGTQAELERTAAAAVKAGEAQDCKSLAEALPAEFDASAETREAPEGTPAMCSLQLTVDGQQKRLIVTQVEGTDAFESTSEVDAGEPVRVSDVADSAVAYHDDLLFRSGDRAYIVSGEDTKAEPISADVRVALARAVVTAIK